jgi:hypothetical protein
MQQEKKGLKVASIVIAVFNFILVLISMTGIRNFKELYTLLFECYKAGTLLMLIIGIVSLYIGSDGGVLLLTLWTFGSVVLNLIFLLYVLFCFQFDANTFIPIISFILSAIQFILLSLHWHVGNEGIRSVETIVQLLQLQELEPLPLYSEKYEVLNPPPYTTF